MDLAIKFWKNWIDERNPMKRLEMIEKLPVIREIADYTALNKITKKERLRTFSLTLDSLFEDLKDTIYCLELKKNKRVTK
jgi:hypothetical protein